jgi:hypothetical protein
MSSVSVIKVGKKKSCKPFLLEVMVMSPEAGYKFEVLVEKGCTATNEAIWKLVFDLYKKIEGQFTQIIHVSFTAGSSAEKKGVQRMVVEGVSDAGASIIKKDLYPVAKKVAESGGQPTEQQREALKKAASRAVTVEL